MKRGVSFGVLWIFVSLLAYHGVRAATPTPEVQKAVKAATFEVVLHKADSDPLSYERPLPLELIPYVIRSDHYWSIGTAFAISPDTYVSAAHVLLSAVGSQFGAPALRDGAGNVYPVNEVRKFSADEDFIVFTVTGAPPAVPLASSLEPRIDDVVFAAGNALGEGVVIRDGLLTSETPEELSGRWKWLRFSAAASPGNSGGPLMDESGKVIGVVRAKSPNENLNYALPMARVLNAGEQATFDQRYSVKLPNARDAQVATLKAQFALPRKFADFAREYQDLILHTQERDQQQLQSALAAKLFPKGNSAKLLATVYDSPLPTFVQQDGEDAWDAVAADNTAHQDLPDNGLVATGTSLGVAVFRLRRPGAASDATLYKEPRQFMDLLLKGLKLPRTVGDQAIRITSLGEPQHTRTIEDKFGRRWQVSEWPLGYVDSYVICYALPVPEGYVGFVSFSPSLELAVTNRYLALLADAVYVNYSGTLQQWKAFLSRRELLPRLFDDVKLDVDSAQGVRYESARFTLLLPRDLLQDSAAGVLELHTAYMLGGDRLTWDVGGVYWYKDEQRHTGVGVERHAKPTDAAAKDLLETWKRMSTHGAGFDGIAGHDDEFRNYWIHTAVSAPSASSPGIDPAANVLYDVYYNTDASVYPRNVEDIERRLIQATHIAER